MRLAFYYHIPAHYSENQLHIPGYLGVFLDELAKHVETLVLIFHSATGNEIQEADYKLKANNIEFLSLGTKTAPWHRTFFPRSILKSVQKEIETCDALLVRSPSPLARAFKHFIKRPKVFFMIVGDYGEGAKQIGKKGVKNLLLNIYFNYSDKKFTSLFSSTDIFVNSPQLYEKYKTKAKSIELIRTTTLQESDFYKKADTGLQSPIQLLYTGRIDLNKGLYELLEATCILVKKKYNVHLNIVGWETNENKPVESLLIKKASEIGISGYITFHGKKGIGEDLNQMYRQSDIYVLPSYHEGFPRTIWEAMANSLPVIATKVGGIPYYLEANKHALLIEPKNISAISEAIELLILDTDLRTQLIQNGFELVQDNTIEKQTFLMIKAMKDQMK